MVAQDPSRVTTEYLSGMPVVRPERALHGVQRPDSRPSVALYLLCDIGLLLAFSESYL